MQFGAIVIKYLLKFSFGHSLDARGAERMKGPDGVEPSVESGAVLPRLFGAGPACVESISACVFLPPAGRRKWGRPGTKVIPQSQVPGHLMSRSYGLSAGCGKVHNPGPTSALRTRSE